MDKYAIHNILAAIDFFPASLNAMETAISMCERHGATLTLLHVVDHSYPSAHVNESGDSTIISSELVSLAAENLKDLAHKIRADHNDLVINTEIKTGRPPDEICQYILLKEIDLVMMGNVGIAKARKGIGSTAYGTLQHSGCAVLTIPVTSTNRDFKNILFPIRMIPHALSRYDVLRPIIRKNSAVLSIAGMERKHDTSGIIDIECVVESAKRIIADDEVSFKSNVFQSDEIDKEILSIAASENPDLIVLTCTLDPRDEPFPGTYTGPIIHQAKHPVLSICPVERESKERSGTDVTQTKI